jgi:hypothetical protein
MIQTFTNKHAISTLLGAEDVGVSTASLKVKGKQGELFAGTFVDRTGTKCAAAATYGILQDYYPASEEVFQLLCTSRRALHAARSRLPTALSTTQPLTPA